MKTFKRFFYDSNHIWGNVETHEELKEKMDIQIESPNDMETVDDFLDRSLQAGDTPNYGTYSEHTGRPLREFLEEEGILDEFLEYLEKSK